MPWKECPAVEERLRFIARRLEGESMTDLCREFRISRKTGPQRTSVLPSVAEAQWRTKNVPCDKAEMGCGLLVCQLIVVHMQKRPLLGRASPSCSLLINAMVRQ
jgi:hypothetical protein